MSFKPMLALTLLALLSLTAAAMAEPPIGPDSMPSEIDLATWTVGDIDLLRRPGGLAVTGRPVRATQAGVGQAHKGAQDNDDEGQHDGDAGNGTGMAEHHFTSRPRSRRISRAARSGGKWSIR